MSNYQLFDLMISCFIAIGTCLASVLALYFWINDKKIRMKIQVMDADSFGNIPSVEGGYFVIIVTNIGDRPQILQLVGLKGYKRKYFKKNAIGLMMCEATDFDKFPKRLEYSESYTYIKPMKEMYDKFQSCDLMPDELIGVVVVTSAKKDIHFRIENSIQLKILDNLRD